MSGRITGVPSAILALWSPFQFILWIVCLSTDSNFDIIFSILQEMWALFDFVCQGKLLGTSRSFKQEYENPIVRVSLIANFIFPHKTFLRIKPG